MSLINILKQEHEYFLHVFNSQDGKPSSINFRLLVSITVLLTGNTHTTPDAISWEICLIGSFKYLSTTGMSFDFFVIIVVFKVFHISIIKK